MRTALKPRKRDRMGRFVSVRKNGQSEIDAQSTMKVPVGLSRIVQPRATYQWLAPGLAAYTPRFIEMILNGAMSGDHTSQYELFRLMLDTWPVLRSCQEELIYGVIRRNIVFDPYTEEDKKPMASAIEREQLVTAVIENMQPDVTRDDNGKNGTIKDIMDAWFKGISVLEIIWHTADLPTQGTVWGVQSTAWVHPSNYGFNEQGQIGLTLPGTPTGYGTTTVPPSPRNQKLIAFPPDRFLICTHKGVSGTSIGGAMLRPLAWWWCATNFSSDWLLNLAQIFGLPFRWATYAASSPDQTVSAICDMLANMGSAGWAAFPEGTTLELKEASNAVGATPQGELLDRADAYARIMILGQTLTGQTIASGRGGQAFGTVEAQLKQDRLDAACGFVAEVINQQLIPAILRQNYGDASEPPRCRFLQETEGTFQEAERDQILCNIGTTIPISHIRQKYNIPEPIGGEDITHAIAKGGGAPAPTAGPSGTRPVGQTPQTPSPSQTPRQVEARVEVADMEAFGRELRKLGNELTTKEDQL
jgi:phage gp29-like protein